MIQDIEPRVFQNQFHNVRPNPDDRFLSFSGDQVLVREEKDKLWYPSFADFSESCPHLMDEAQFLFVIDEIRFFLVKEQELDVVPGWIYASTSRFRTETKYWRSFAGAIGWQLNRWYQDHAFCSRCGKPTVHSNTERMLYCPACGFQAYPKISPCVIVAVHQDSRLLLTKYRGRPYANFALIAGFVEVGETLEEAVHREVLEEVGLRVKNLSFYKSQPWPFSDSILAGFFAELDGDDTITLQEEELALGVWLDRSEIPVPELKISLTGEMIERFRSGPLNL